MEKVVGLDTPLNNKKVYFKDVEEFVIYMIKNKPYELWLDSFSKSAPFIVVSFLPLGSFFYRYNNHPYISKCPLESNDFSRLFYEGIFIKNIINYG